MNAFNTKADVIGLSIVIVGYGDYVTVANGIERVIKKAHYLFNPFN